MLKLTPQNYHSIEANQAYMSNSQLKNWLTCPARTHAELAGQWDTGPKKALLMGSYVDICLLSELELPKWWAENTSNMIEVGMLSKAKSTYGQKNKDMRYADSMIERAKSDPLFMKMLSGESQRIFTAEIDGVPFRAMMDSFNLEEKRITDLKTTKSTTSESWFTVSTIFDKMQGAENFHRFKGQFFDEWGYFTQLSLYREIASKQLGIDMSDWDLMIAAISKDRPADVNPMLEESRSVHLRILEMSADQNALEQELTLLRDRLPQVARWKSGEDIPPCCGKCAFCRAVQPAVIEKVTSVVWEL